MDYLVFFSLFDDSIHLTFDDDDIFVVKKIAFKNEFKTAFICFTERKR